MNHTAIKEVYEILEQYECTSQDVHDRWPYILEKEEFVLTKAECVQILNEYYLGISEEVNEEDQYV